MKRNLITAAFLIMAAGLFLWACGTDEPESVDIPEIDGIWDVLVMPDSSQIVIYTVEVTNPGSAGTAEISVRSTLGDKSGPSVVQSGTPVPVGACGVTITFNSANGLWLDLGDVWTIQVRGDEIYNPGAAASNTSTVSQVISGGTYTCSDIPCQNGLLLSGAPPIALGQGQLMSGQVEFPSLEVGQQDANFSAPLPEITVLSLTLMGHQLGDDIGIRYHRRIDWDGEGGDFFSVRLYNGDTIVSVEHASASMPGEADRYRALTFTAGAAILRVDFIFGLSGPEDQVWLDEVGERVNGSVSFSDNFTSVTFQDDLPGAEMRWEPRTPSGLRGELGISAVGALEGTYSVLVRGGQTRVLQGSIMVTSSVLGLSLISGLSGLGGGGQGGFDISITDPEQLVDIGGDATQVSNVTFSIFEGPRGGFYSSFGGGMENNDLIIGTFRGEEGDHTCTEEGQFLITIDSGRLLGVEGTWTLQLAGEAESCGSVGRFTQTLGPFVVTQSGEWFSSDPAAPIADGYGNGYTLQGRSIGNLIYFLLGDYTKVSARTSTFLGTEGEEGIFGAFSGTMLANNGLECTVNGTYTLTISQ